MRGARIDLEVEIYSMKLAWVFENKVLRRISGLKRGEKIVWIKSHNDLRNLHS
jgi:hypothetical protein